MAYEHYLIDQNEAPDIVDQSNAPAVIYLGWCKSGTTSTANPTFKIKRITEAGGVTTTMWAEGNREKDKIFDNRALYNYTFIK